MIDPHWTAPSAEQAAFVTGILSSKKIVATHYLPSGDRVEVAHVAVATPLWLVTWTGDKDAAWPLTRPENVLARIEMGKHRQQTWIFTGEEPGTWSSLLWDAWGLCDGLTTRGLA